MVPNLIEQPTWGGRYIGRLKTLPYPKIQKMLIGQSYELFTSSYLSRKKSTLNSPSVSLGSSKNPENMQVISKRDHPFLIKDLINSNPEKVLGKKYLDKLGSKIKTLIKLTQAKGNSYQIHVKKPIGKWLPKPESWYFFEPGLITLGVVREVDWDDYKKDCLAIYKKAQEISKKAKSGKIKIESARKRLKELVDEHHPRKYVNQLKVKKDQGVDLSFGGVHHSWEESAGLPKGNIVYEVQENVYDDVSTLRSFDKGKIKDDGSVRKLQIDDYFEYIDRSAEANNPNNHLVKSKVVKKSENMLAKQIFDNPKYKMQEIKTKGEAIIETQDSFDHLFVKSGKINIVTQETELEVSQGHSVFVPAGAVRYQVKPDKESVILKTYL